MKVGVFGGTFDPIHVGHMVIAEQVADALRLDKVFFIPGGIPTHKSLASVKADAMWRLRMVEAAVTGNPGFTVDSVEVDAGRPMYSIDTVRLLKERYPGEEWYFISGADAVAELLTWKEPDALLEEVVMVAATRPGYDLSALKPLRERLKNFKNIIPVECSRIDISSTEIRERIAGGKSVRYMVPEGVYAIIEQEGLYKFVEERLEEDMA